MCVVHVCMRARRQVFCVLCMCLWCVCGRARASVLTCKMWSPFSPLNDSLGTYCYLLPHASSTYSRHTCTPLPSPRLLSPSSATLSVPPSATCSRPSASPPQQERRGGQRDRQTRSREEDGDAEGVEVVVVEVGQRPPAPSRPAWLRCRAGHRCLACVQWILSCRSFHFLVRCWQEITEEAGICSILPTPTKPSRRPLSSFHSAIYFFHVAR